VRGSAGKKTKAAASAAHGRASEAQVRRFAKALPGAHEDHPWGETVVKVKNKVFVFLGKGDGRSLGLSVKLPQSGEQVLELPFAQPTGYGLGKAGWVSLGFDPGDEPPLAAVCSWVEESYRAIAPKKLVAELDARRG
jgi:predicted DNA-binding protein (MmcQ/YjbR family)